jgi:DNA-directed RNA polymerase subunit H (RpoH/RPB5)
MADQSVEYRLWRSNKTVRKMLVLRDYQIPRVLPFDKWIERFAESTNLEFDIKRSLNHIYEKDDGVKTLVYFHTEKKFGNNGLSKLREEIEKNNITKTILIVEREIPGKCRQNIKALRAHKIYIDDFTIEETQIDVTKFRLASKHEICTPTEKKEILKSYNVTAKQLPIIKPNDPNVRYLGAIKGQLVRITRKSYVQPGTETLFYRIVR